MGLQGRDESNSTRQSANLPGVTDISSSGRVSSSQSAAPRVSGLRGRGEGAGVRPIGVAGPKEGPLRLDGFASKDSWVTEAVTQGSLSLLWAGSGPSCRSSFPVSRGHTDPHQREGGREQRAAIHIWTILSTGSH